MVLIAARATDAKKAGNISILEMAKLLGITDYFLICTGATDRQTKTIADEVRKQLREAGRKPDRISGDDLGDWILLDYSDFVVHIFTEEMHDYYQLERLWKDAPRVPVGEEERSGAQS